MPLFALEPPTVPMDVIDYPEAIEQCLYVAADMFDLPTLLMRAVLRVENGEPGMVSVNSDGTLDAGWFQINSVNWPAFEPYGITAELLIWNPCANAFAAHYLMRERFDAALSDGEIGSLQDYIRVAARYHSSTHSYNLIYQGKLVKAMNYLASEAD